MLNTAAPLCLFVYNRPERVKKTIDSLLANTMAKQTDVYIFSDGPKIGSEEEVQLVKQVREIVAGIQGFKSVHFHFAHTNMGLADSIISGVSRVINKEERIIVLEDDLVVAENFLAFMNQALDAYQNNPKIFSVAGYSIPIVCPGDKDVYFTLRASSWGWATWKDRWSAVDWNVSDYNEFLHDPSAKKAFNRMGSDLTGMLNKQMSKRINSWAIRWTYHQFRQNLLTVFPRVSKVSNEGFSNGATHTSSHNRSRFATVLDTSTKTAFEFPENAVMCARIIREFTRPYTLPVRLLYKLRGMFQ